ncbi:fasciclin domain-containing protein [Deinococcus sp. A31D244]|uniref:Fasciclin domain-containing protein n=1 Tax=Deinococcus aquaticus TaxID=328692 RepID=A0ABY7V612_9DEIO|nr:fasciclin domain-containing protein [Deinococcus aquaticus]WDA60261.1 fasciclin domain-containing protein [Deinococcus aquaticus]
MKKHLLLSALALSSVAFAGGGSMVPSSNTIAGIVANDPNFSTLLAAVQAAGLTETLNGTGPFTVFAPTNAAFAKIPKADLDALLNNPEQLKAVLLYHVVSGKVTAAQVMTMSSATTVNGADVTVSTSGGKVMINDSTVTKANVMARNGVIHVIDTVLMP